MRFQKQKMLRAALAVAMLWSSGCTPFREYVRNGFKVGPNYCAPPAPVAQDWIDALDARVDENRPDLAHWWMVLGDPTLDALILNAAQQNLTVRQAGFRVLQARAARAIAAGNLFPQQQQAVGGYSRNALSAEVANREFIAERFFDQWDAGFGLAWELDFWGRFRRALEAADADLDATVEEYDQVLVTLIGDIAATYVEVRTLQQRIDYVQANIQLQRQTYIIADANARAGQVSELDVDQSISTLAQTESLIPQYELQLRQATNQLCILLGMPPLDLIQIIARGPIPRTPPGLVVGIPADLLRQRPDVRRNERLVAAQSARVGVATSELYPHISITGSLGYSAENFSSLFSKGAFTGSVGPSFQWNILNYGRLINNIRLHDARLAELIVAYQGSVLQANLEAENGIAQFLRSQEQARALARSVEASVKAVNIAVAQYKGGETDFNRVSLLQQNLVQQQDLYAVAQGEIVAGLVETYRALGGGWQIRLDPWLGPVPIPPGPMPVPGDRALENLPLPAPTARQPQPEAQLAYLRTPAQGHAIGPLMPAALSPAIANPPLLMPAPSAWQPPQEATP